MIIKHDKSTFVEEDQTQHAESVTHEISPHSDSLLQKPGVNEPYLFFVKVPVLSEARISTPDSSSRADSLFTKAFSLAISLAPIANTVVVTTGIPKRSSHHK